MSETKPAIALVGPGRMGRGMAHAFAYAGYPVTVVDFKDRAPEDYTRIEAEMRTGIAGDLAFLSSLDVLSESQAKAVLGLIAFAPPSGSADVLAAADFIFEGVPETRQAKAGALGRIGREARQDAVCASTTSTMLVTELQGLIAHPERFVNAHFLNPAYLIPLVEISPGPGTDEAVTARLIELFEAAGKVPVRCSASPGYIIPRLQSLLLSETARMIAEGVASAEDIDKAIVNGFGPRYATMGTAEFMDWGGVDIVYYAGNYLAEALDSPRHKPPPELDAMMKDGRKGLREGRGYYDYSKIDVEAYKRQKLTGFVHLLRYLDRLPPPGV
ncbi:MAG: 3-hydroxyacyl-CoA dehydrogenase NAD-binding domain-containing protein [Alphaproteobacteria bacterium]